MTIPEGSPERPGDDRRTVIGINLTGSRGTGRLALGVILLGLGVLLTLDNMGVVNAGRVLRLWPVLLIYFGVRHLARRPRRLVSGSILTGLGALLLLGQLDVFRMRPEDIFPLILVFLGFLVIVRAVRGRPGQPAAVTMAPGGSLGREINDRVRDEMARGMSGTNFGGAAPNVPPSPHPDDRDQTIHAFAMMAGVTRKSGASEFRGGDATALMGAVEIDLRNARPAANVVVLDVTALWGGIDILIPRDWAVSGDVTPLLGAFQDNSHHPAGQATATLYVRGVIIMGGVEVKN